MKIGQITLRIFFLIIASDAMDTIAQLAMKRGLNSPETIFFWIGILIYISTFFLWMTVLREVDLSVALPIGSISYIVVPLAAMFLLHEHVNIFRWIGIMLIVFGIWFVSQSKMGKGDHHV